MRRLRTRAAIAAHQERQLARLAHHLRANVPFYHGRDAADWPAIDKAVLLDRFDRFNVARLPLARVEAALGRGQTRVDGYTVGHSTGTSGRRGYYVIAERERFVWLGTLLAKALPDALWRRHRVALALPGFSRLYAAADGGSRIRLAAFDLGEGLHRWEDELAAFAPDTIVAPPQVLRLLAERGRLSARTIFSAAEVLDPDDRALIKRASGRPVRQIYMATEGLFGVSCPHGTLHLAEDVVRFEWLPDEGGLVQPVVTDFTRRAQAMVRYRMNDLLRLDPAPCPCGCAFQAVSEVVGRRDDVLLLPAAGGGWRAVTPDVVRDALLDADRSLADFRVEQVGALDLRLALPAGFAGEAAAVAALEDVARRFDAVVPTVVVTRGIAPDLAAKRRRVRRCWSPDHSIASAS